MLGDCVKQLTVHHPWNKLGIGFRGLGIRGLGVWGFRVLGV